MEHGRGPLSVTAYIVRRLIGTIPLIGGVLVITFVLIHLAPGDPTYILAGEGGDEAYYAQIRAQYGLDRPLPEQLGRYLLEVLRGDLGYSFHYQQRVVGVIGSRVPATLLLTGTAFLFSTVLGLGLGILGALRPRTPTDHGLAALSLTFFSMPVFWLGQLLIIVFAVGLKLFPVQGMTNVRESYTGLSQVGDVLHHLALPALTLGLVQLAQTARLTRTSLREVMQEDFIRTARAKGLRRRQVVLGHALRNALLPVVTALGSQIGVLLTGAALTETIFAWPGLGRLLLDATLTRDYPVLMALFILVTITVIVANLLTDLSYLLLDPRVRYT